LGLATPQNYIAVEVGLLAVIGEAGYFTEGRCVQVGSDCREQVIDLIVAGVVAEAVDTLGVLPAEQVVARSKGRQAVRGTTLVGDGGGFAGQTRIV